MVIQLCDCLDLDVRDRLGHGLLEQFVKRSDGPDTAKVRVFADDAQITIAIVVVIAGQPSQALWPNN